MDGPDIDISVGVEDALNAIQEVEDKAKNTDDSVKSVVTKNRAETNNLVTETSRKLEAVKNVRNREMFQTRASLMAMVNMISSGIQAVGSAVGGVAESALNTISYIISGVTPVITAWYWAQAGHPYIGAIFAAIAIATTASAIYSQLVTIPELRASVKDLKSDMSGFSSSLNSVIRRVG